MNERSDIWMKWWSNECMKYASWLHIYYPDEKERTRETQIHTADT